MRLTGLVYGDQGLFVDRRRFERIGGFPPLRLMEDVFLSKTLRRRGADRGRAAAHLRVAAPLERQGVVRQTLRNWALTALAAGGVHPDRLAAFYPVVR